MSRSPSAVGLAGGGLFLLSSLSITAYATPLPYTSADSGLNSVSAGYLALALCLPFLVLIVLKYVYLKYRRAQTIHHAASESTSNRQVASPALDEKQRSPLVGLGLDASASGAPRLPLGLLSEGAVERGKRPVLGLGIWRKAVRQSLSFKARVDLQGYLVGFLGSPTWETRIKTRADKVVRRDMTAISTPGSAHQSNFSPCSTLSRYPGTSPHLSPHLSTTSAYASHSQSSRPRTASSLPSSQAKSTGGKNGSLNSSTRTRASTANYGSVSGQSNLHSSGTSGSGSRSRRGHRRSASVSVPSSRRASGSASGSGSTPANGDMKGSRGSGSRRHSNSSRHGSVNSSTNRTAHSRSLSLSFLEMNTPVVGNPGSVSSSLASDADFAKIATQALASISGAALPRVGSLRKSSTARTHSSTATSASVSKHQTATGITDCASIHPASAPCPANPVPITTSSKLSALASSGSLRPVSPPLSLKSVSMPKTPHITTSRADTTTPHTTSTPSSKATPSSSSSHHLSPRYYSPSALSPSTIMDKSTPIQHQGADSTERVSTPAISPELAQAMRPVLEYNCSYEWSTYTPKDTPASLESKAPENAKAAPVCEPSTDSKANGNKRTSAASITSSSSIRACLTVSIASPVHSPRATPSLVTPAEEKTSPASGLTVRKGSPAPGWDENKYTYLSPTKSSVAKTKPLNVTSRARVSPLLSSAEDKNTTEPEQVKDQDTRAKKSRRKLSIMGLGFSTSSSQTALAATSTTPAKLTITKTEPEPPSFHPSLSGCASHYRGPRARSPSASPQLMPGALPLTPSASAAPARTPTPKRLRGRGRPRASVSGPSTPNPDEFGVSGSEDGAGKGASSEEVEGMLVFDVGSAASSSLGSSGKGSTGKESEKSGKLRQAKAESWTSWDLDDLMTMDGRLDVDAVSAALGLGAAADGENDGEGDDYSFEARSVNGNENGDEDDADNEELENSIESLVRQPGSQLYPIIEEDDPESSVPGGLPVSATQSPHASYSLQAPPNARVPRITADSGQTMAIQTSNTASDRPASYVVVGGARSSPAAATPSAPGAPPPTPAAAASLAFLTLPVPSNLRDSAYTVSSTDARGSVNESVLDFDLQLDLTGFGVGDDGFGAEGQGDGEFSLFGIGGDVSRIQFSKADRDGHANPGDTSLDRDDANHGAGVGVAF